MAPQSPRHILSTPPARRRRPGTFFRPRCEQLEDRFAPALFNVQSPLTFTGLNNNGFVAVADFNKDDLDDAVLTNFGSDYGSGAGTTITVLYGREGGGFNRINLNTSGQNVSFAAIADINDDSYPDVVVTNANRQNAGTVSVFRNDGAGNLSLFATPFSTFSNNPSWVGLVDITGDDVLDVVVGSFGKDEGSGTNVVGNNVTIFEGNVDTEGKGNFTFSGSPITTLAPEIQFIPTALAIADFDSDGLLDIAAAVPGVPLESGQPQPTGNVYLFEGTGSGGFAAPNTFETGGALPVNIQAGDLNGDNKPDLVIANAGDPTGNPEFVNDAVGVLMNVTPTNGSSSFAIPISLTANTYGTFAVAIADFDLDGKKDIASVNYGSQLLSPPAFVSVYMGNGSGAFNPASPGTFDTQTGLGGGQYLAVGNFDTNPSPDLIVAHASNRVGQLFNTTVTGPTVTINQAAGQADPTNASPITFDVVFSTGVTGFTAADISFTGSTIGGLSATVTPISTTAYTVTVTGMTGSGLVRASVPAGAATSISGAFPSLASTSTDNQVTFDNVAATVTINQASGQADPTSAAPITFTVLFSESVSGFGSADVDFSGSSLSGLSATVTQNTPSNYTVAVTGMSGNGTVMARVVAGAAADAAGNTSEASTSTDNTVTFVAATAPTVTINQGAGQNDPTNSSSIVFDVRFSEGVTGFTSADVDLSGSSVGGLKATVAAINASTYTVSVTDMAGTGTVRAVIPAGAATSIAGSVPSLASSSDDNQVTFDLVSPTVTINQANGQADPATTGPILFTVIFSENVTGFGSADIDLSGSALSGLSATVTQNTPSNYTVSVTGMAGTGTVIARVLAGGASDAVGNGSAASTSSDNTVTFAVAPTVTINQGVAQADPTNSMSIVFDVLFSEGVTGFTNGDIDLSGSSVGDLSASVSAINASTYTVTVTGMAGTGTVRAFIPAGAATSIAGSLPSQASTSGDNQVTFDRVSPTVTIDQANGQTDPATSGPILFTVVFSESVTGFGSADVDLSGSSLSGLSATVTQNTPANYTVSVTGMAGTGTVIARVLAGGASDAVGNGSAASTSSDNTVTFAVAPTVTINQGAAQADPTNSTSIVFAVVFSTGVTGFTDSDVDLTGSSVGGLLASVTPITSSVYTVAVTRMTGTGTVMASIPAGAATSIDGSLPSLASTSGDNQVTFDLVLPTVSINQANGQPDPATSGPILFTVIFSENVTGFGSADVDLSNSSLGGLSATVTQNTPSNYTVSVTGMAGAGTVVAHVVAGAASDSVGNASTASSSNDNTVAFDSPAVTINQRITQADPTNSAPITFDVQFSQVVTGFDSSDVLFTGSTVGGTLVAAVSGASPGQNYTVTVTGMTGVGTVVASVRAGAATNGAGTGNAASTSTDNTVTFDAVAPTVTINQALGQSDPTSVPSIQFDVKFSEAVTGFGPADVSLAGSTAGGTLLINVTGSLDTYSVTVTGMTTSGSVIASIPAAGAVDAAGNTSSASSSTDNSVQFLNTTSVGTLGFLQAVFSTTEDPAVHTVTITVTRTGGTGGAVSIQYSTSDGSAHSGGPSATGQDDYTPTSGILNWAAGETDKTFTIEIRPDALNEGKELINLALTGAVGGPGLGLTNAIVAIAPSDGQGPGRYLDQDGDKVTIKLAGKTGSLLFFRTDADGDGKGPIELIELTNTLPNPAKPKAALVVSSGKSKTSTDGGTVGLGAITGAGLKSIVARKANLNLEGINLTGYLGTLTIGNIVNGADITTGAGTSPKQATKINALVIGDGSVIDVGARVSSLTATSFGAGLFKAPSVTTISIKGAMAADVIITGVGVDPTRNALNALKVKGPVIGSDIMVTGNVGAVSVGAFRDSRLFAGYTGADDGSGTFNAAATVGTFKSTGRVDGFQNSRVIATQFKSVTVANLDMTNPTKFGFYADVNLGAITVLGPTRWQYNATLPTPQGVPGSSDFEVRIV